MKQKKKQDPGRRWYPRAVKIKHMRVQTTRSQGFLRDLERLCKKYAGSNFTYNFIVEDE